MRPTETMERTHHIIWTVIEGLGTVIEVGVRKCISIETFSELFLRYEQKKGWKWKNVKRENKNSLAQERYRQVNRCE